MENVSQNFLEQRRYERISTKKFLRVYTSLTNAAYTVNVSNISQKGAFIKTPYLPRVGEVITFEALDDNYFPLYIGQALVKWVEKDMPKDQWGFGVEFEDILENDIIKKIH